MEEKKELTGFVTFKELCAYFQVSDKTLTSRLEPLRLFLHKPGKRKRLYSPEEVKFIIHHLDNPNRKAS